MNSKISEKDKKTWDDFLSNNQKLPDKDNFQAKIKSQKIRSLDLHGKTLSAAKISLSQFINSSIKNNIRCILVITGKKKTLNGSRGLIRENLPLWLKENELVNYILFHCFATKKDGGDGARYILLRKKDKVFYG